ncbi:hypothetical protein SK128_024090 [Halocaridina rubra]|uniref:Uncharacterized protein n=1 Tax=Halocaridina rubra TaxID=373956 RepID=A0AAN8XMY2_HALRR
MALTTLDTRHPMVGTDTRIHGLTPEHTIMMNSQQNHTVETNHGQTQEQTTTMTMDTTLMKHAPKSRAKSALVGFLPINLLPHHDNVDYFV